VQKGPTFYAIVDKNYSLQATVSVIYRFIILANIQMELKVRFIFIISCWPGGPTPYRIRWCPDWGYLRADKFERGLSQVQGPTRIRPLEILQHNQIASLKNYFLNRARDNTFFNALVSADKGYTPLNLSDNIISDIVEPNISDTMANIKQKSLHGRYFKELEQPEINIQASHAWLKKSNIHPETEGFIFAIQDRVVNTRNYKKHICGLQSIIDKCRICGTEGETIENIISSCTVLAQSEYKKRHDIFAKIIHLNLAVKFNLLKDTQPHYIYKPESCLENENYKLYFDRTVLRVTDTSVD
jgi:hypothetical protein